jgi:hypothetical protein
MDEDWFRLKPYCIITSPATSNKILQEYIFLFILDLVATTLHILVILANKNKLSKFVLYKVLYLGGGGKIF